jgi:hypothetical protein
MKVRAIPTNAASPGAIALGRVARNKLGVATQTALLRAQNAIAPSTVRIQSRRAIGTNHLQILQPVIVPNPVDVVEDQRHRSATPDLTLPAELTFRLLNALG